MASRVMFLHKFFFAGGGIERVSQNLARGLQAQGERCSFYVWHTQGDAAPGYQCLARQFAASSPSQSASLLTRLAQLRCHIQRQRVDVLIAATEKANMLAFLCKLWMPSVRVIFTRHSAFDTREQRLPVWVVKLLYNLYALQRGTIVAVSKTLREQLRSAVLFGASRIQYVPNAVISDELFSLAEHATTPLPDGAYFCAVGRLVEEKGFDLLLQAYAIALHRQPALPELVIVGGGELDCALKQLANQLGLAQKVRFTGFVSNPYGLMRHASAFILSSRHEGMPTVMIEAMALGCNVIAFDCPTGPAELLNQPGSGTLVNAGDIEALADALVTNQATSVQDDSVVHQFHQSQVAQTYRQFFQEQVWRE